MGRRSYTVPLHIRVLGTADLQVKDFVLARHRKTSQPIPSRVVASALSLSDVGHRGRHRSVAGPGRRGNAIAAAATGAVLFAGYQAAAPAMAQAHPVVEHHDQVQQYVANALSDSGVAQPGRDQLMLDAQAALGSIASNAQAVLDTFAIDTPGAPAPVTPEPAGSHPEGQVATAADFTTSAGGWSPAPAVEPTGGSVASLTPALPGSQRAVVPVSGTLTSDYGPRWGTTHWGLDIANSIGTPILAAADGTVVEAGPASGFGLWVRVLHDDGTTTVYGHINEYLVEQGQRVQAGQQIATVGNRGESTGPHLHFEVWDADGSKTDPKQWLAQRGAALDTGSLGSLS